MHETLAQVETALADLVDRPAWPLHDDDVVTGLSRLDAVASQVTALTAALVRELDARALPATHGASSTPVWLREHLRISIQTAHRITNLARLLSTRPVLRDAMVTGGANAEQISVIGAALAGLPDDLDPALVDKAEALLVDHSRRFEPAILRRLGERVLSHLAPEIAEEALRRALDRDEARAHVSRTLAITADGNGRCRVSGWLDTEAAAIVSAALDPLCKPAPTTDGLDPRTPGQRRADALTDVCRFALTTDRLPDSGGQRPQVTVTVGLDALSMRLGPGTLDTGQVLSPASVRRLACDAQIIPAVLGGDGAVLDLGRTRRVYTGAVRRALVVRDGGCAFPGCDRPPRWCQAHHITHWLDGGHTNLDNGVLLCGHHHRVIHQGHWSVRIGAGRRPEFVPPAHIDPQRHPRRNNYHHRP